MPAASLLSSWSRSISSLHLPILLYTFRRTHAIIKQVGSHIVVGIHHKPLRPTPPALRSALLSTPVSSAPTAARSSVRTKSAPSANAWATNLLSCNFSLMTPAVYAPFHVVHWLYQQACNFTESISQIFNGLTSKK